MGSTDSSGNDAVLERRERYRGIASRAQKFAYVLYALSSVGFFFGLLTSYNSLLVTAVVSLLIVASVVLAVAIQVTYAIRGAERHEEESAAQRRRP